MLEYVNEEISQKRFVKLSKPRCKNLITKHFLETYI